ncbi:MAG: aromatic ring-hydroxylating dioxygenase subunit alpha [Candidatus Lokiarchaeota archaeon]|nr:aromatic ring-hydroxylating dioxygenase subunit alpha [Candidatus Lokiarchaeota archaeon]
MIRNQWYAVLESRELPKDKLVGVTRLGENLIFWRNKKSEVICLKDKCAHRGAKLSIGKICDDGELIECPFHGLRYDRTGKCTIIPANGKNSIVPERFKVDNYPTREEYDFIWIWWGDEQFDYPALPFFEDIDRKFSYKTHAEIWPVHYSRAIENQLDVIHLPFVHSNTIGRGYQTLVHGPLIEPDKEGNGFTFWVYNQKDDGNTRPLKPEEFTDDMKVFHLNFKFPHIWQNYLGEKVRIFIAFVPIDENNTQFYMRFYQKFIRIPILKSFVNWLANKFNIIILHQDRRVVVTQLPTKTQLKMNEQLIQGDNPIVYYRRRREELKSLKQLK